MLKATLRPNGYWYASGSIDGKQIRRSLKLPRNASKAEAEKLLARENARLFERRVRGQKAVLTFADAALFYMRAKGKSYFENDRNAARQLKVLITEFGNKQVSDITGADLADFCERRYPRCKPQSRKRFVYVWMNAIIRMNAVADRCDLKVFKAPGVPKRAPVEPAPEDWLAKFVLAARTGRNRWGKPLRNGVRIAAMVLFMSFTGARVSEAMRVKPEDIHERSGGALWAYLGRTKNGKARYVRLHPVVVRAITQLEMEPGKPIFGFNARKSVLDAIKRVCKHANLPYYTTHKAGRHAFAKRMLDNGHTLMDVKDGGGWESLTVVAESYGHLEQSRVHEAVANVSTNLAQVWKDDENAIKSIA